MKQIKYAIINNVYELNGGNKFIITNLTEVINKYGVSKLMIYLDKPVYSDTLLKYGKEKDYILEGIPVKLEGGDGILFTSDTEYFNSILQELDKMGFIIKRTHTIRDILDLLLQNKVKITHATLINYIRNHLIKKVDYDKIAEYKIYDSGLRKALLYYLD